MAASKVNANWSTVTHGANAITRVTTASFNLGGSLASFSADTDKYPTLIANLANKPTFSIGTADVGNILDATKFAPGTDATLSATLKDAKGASGGDVIFSMTHAVIENVQTTGQHAQFSSGTITGQAYSTDGTTSPLSITRGP